MVKSIGWANNSEKGQWNNAAQQLNHDVRKELNYAVNDIRQQVVERGWFGRQVTPDHSTHGFYHTADLSPSKDPSPSHGELKPSKVDEIYGRDYQPIEPETGKDHSHGHERGSIDR